MMAEQNTRPVSGKVSSLEVSKDGTAWKKVLGRVDVSLSLTKGSVEAGHMDSGGWSNYLHGRRDWSIDGTVRYLEDDPGQKILFENFFADEEYIHVRFRMAQGQGQREWTGQCFVTDDSLDTADEAPSDVSITLQGDGPLTPADQGAPAG